MKKFNRIVALAAAAMLVVILIGAAAPALADTTPANPYPTADPSTYVPILVTETQDTSAYWAPGQSTEFPLFAGQSWYVLGQDSTGKWIEIYVTGSVSLWLPRADMAVGGAPLPVTG